MSRFPAQTLLCALGIALLVTTGCARRPSRLKPPSIDSGAAGTEAVAAYDTDGDGKIGGDELEKTPGLKAGLSKLDTDADQKISADEITSRIEVWQNEHKIAIMSVSCQVLYGGRPLDGATVTLVPESFLGENVKPATGTTSNGMASLSIAESDRQDPTLTGVQCGFFSVKVEHPSVKLPEKFNTNTTLGIEIALDAPEIIEGWTLNLR